MQTQLHLEVELAKPMSDSEITELRAIFQPYLSLPTATAVSKYNIMIDITIFEGLEIVYKILQYLEEFIDYTQPLLVGNVSYGSAGEISSLPVYALQNKFFVDMSNVLQIYSMLGGLKSE